MNQKFKNILTKVKNNKIIRRTAYTATSAGLVSLFLTHLLFKDAKRTKELILLILLVCVTLAILFFSLSDAFIFYIDDYELTNSGPFAHLISYFVLSALLALYLNEREKNMQTGIIAFVKRIFTFNKPKLEKTFLKSALISGCYGSLIEVLQSFITYRSFAYDDITINFIGAFAVFLLYPILKKN